MASAELRNVTRPVTIAGIVLALASGMLGLWQVPGSAAGPDTIPLPDNVRPGVEPGDTDTCPTGVIHAAALPRVFKATVCHLTGRTVSTPMGALIIPVRGQGVGAEGVLAGGRTETFTLEHRADGALVTGPSDSDQSASARRRAGDSGCSDFSYTTDLHHFTSPWVWFFHRNGVSNAKALKRAIDRGLQDIAGRDSNCGVTNPLPATAQPSYAGTTTNKPNVSIDAGCGPTDGKNIVGFGPLNSYWGYTCWWWTSGHVTTEADVLIRNDLAWWTASSLAGCFDRPDLEGLMAHEFGHAFGLSHVAEQTHPDQTMSTYINGLCSKRERTLGSGDLAGLNALYGS